MIPLSEVRPRRVRWLWRPYIPAGRVTIVEGDPGMGKSWLLIDIASRVTRGENFPVTDRSRRSPSSVIYLTAEDDVSDTIRKRFIDAGADLDRVFVSDSPVHEQIQYLHEVGDSLGPIGLIVVDPIQAYIPMGVTKARKALESLFAVAMKHNCAVVCIRHFTKSSGRASITRGLGTIDISAFVRSIIAVGESNLYPDIRVMAHVKSSLSPPGPSLGFVIRNNNFHWKGVVDVSPGDIVGSSESTENRTAYEEAIMFLNTMLADGPVPAALVKKEAGHLGISNRTLFRARKALGVKSRREMNHSNGKFMWVLYKSK